MAAELLLTLLALSLEGGPSACATTVAVVNAPITSAPDRVGNPLGWALLEAGFELVDPPGAAHVVLELDDMRPEVHVETDRGQAEKVEVQCSVGVRVARGMELPLRLAVEGKTCDEAAGALGRALVRLLDRTRPCAPGPVV
jgi:hypothetical protein